MSHVLMLAIMHKKKPIHRPKQINLLSGNNEIYHVHRFLFPYLMGRHYTLHISQSLWSENRVTCTLSNEGMWAINFNNKGCKFRHCSYRVNNQRKVLSGLSGRHIYFTDLWKASLRSFALKSRERTFPNTGRDVRRGPGGMFLNS